MKSQCGHEGGAAWHGGGGSEAGLDRGRGLVRLRCDIILFLPAPRAFIYAPPSPDEGVQEAGGTRVLEAWSVFRLASRCVLV